MAHVAPYIVARTMQEAHAFAREDLGLDKGTYRVVNSPSTLSAVRGADLYLVPGWESRYDRFAMKGAIRWTRMNVIDVAGQAEKGVDFVVTFVPDDTVPPKSHTDLVARVLPEDENGNRMISEGGPVSVLIEVEPEPEKPKKRRRSRCSECGDLHFKDDPCTATDDPFPVE